MDKNISVVTQLLGNLRNMAIDIGNEVVMQNQLIDHVNMKVGLFSIVFLIIFKFLFNKFKTHSNYLRTHDAKKRANRLLKM
jgi:hypothetical protein